MANSTVFVTPKSLQEGDTVAVVSPSWGGPSMFPHVFDLGLKNLRERFGLNIREFPTARRDADALYRDPQARADDINQAFAYSEIKAIFASIGGDDSVRILPYIDTATVRANPKILMGYSDTTTLLTWINQQGIVTYNGSSVMAGFAQLPQFPGLVTDHLRALLFKPTPTYAYRPYPVWADKYQDWRNPQYDGEVSALQRNDEGWQWLQGTGTARGRLFGGCIEVLEFFKSTRFWPSPDFWQNKILFFETSEDKPSVDQVTWFLRNYGMQGIFDRISGLLIGRARSYTDAEKAELYRALVRVVAGEFGRSDLPIVANLDFGHTDPQFILPLGIEAELDCGRHTFMLQEPATMP